MERVDFDNGALRCSDPGGSALRCSDPGGSALRCSDPGGGALRCSDLVDHVLENSCFGFVRDRRLLVQILRDADEVVGGLELKRLIISQLKTFAVNFKAHGDPLGARPEMTNVCILGPPGSGKTMCGTILARFWSACLDKGVSAPHAKGKPGARKGIVSVSGDGAPMLSAREELIRIMKAFKSERADSGSVRSSKSGDSEDSIPCIIPDGQTPSVYGSSLTSPLFRIITRASLVDKFQGHTAQKTLSLIEEAQGGTVFVDEAYSLYLGRGDSFGMEAITEINKYMDENPRGIRWIFAGYEDKMEESIFRAQPGFRRRFTTRIRLGEYSRAELYGIFLVEARARGLEIDIPESDTKRVIRSVEFPDHGGSVSNLCALLGEIIDSENFTRVLNGEQVSRKVTLSHLERAVSEYSKSLPPKEEIPNMFF